VHKVSLWCTKCLSARVALVDSDHPLVLKARVLYSTITAAVSSLPWACSRKEGQTVTGARSGLHSRVSGGEQKQRAGAGGSTAEEWVRRTGSVGTSPAASMAAGVALLRCISSASAFCPPHSLSNQQGRLHPAAPNLSSAKGPNVPWLETRACSFCGLLPSLGGGSPG